MEKVIVKILLVAYIASFLKPALPYLSDSFAHTFYYAKHVKTVHVENGQEHVHYELAKQNKKDSKETEEAIKKFSVANEYMVIEKDLETFNPANSIQYFSYNSSKALIAWLHGDYPPPRC